MWAPTTYPVHSSHVYPIGRSDIEALRRTILLLVLLLLLFRVVVFALFLLLLVLWVIFGHVPLFGGQREHFCLGPFDALSHVGVPSRWWCFRQSRWFLPPSTRSCVAWFRDRDVIVRPRILPARRFCRFKFKPGCVGFVFGRTCSFMRASSACTNLLKTVGSRFTRFIFFPCDVVPRRATTFVRDASSVPWFVSWFSFVSFSGGTRVVFFHPSVRVSSVLPSVHSPLFRWPSASTTCVVTCLVSFPIRTHLGLFEDDGCVVEGDGFSHGRTTCSCRTPGVGGGQFAIAVGHEFGRSHRHVVQCVQSTTRTCVCVWSTTGETVRTDRVQVRFETACGSGLLPRMSPNGAETRPGPLSLPLPRIPAPTIRSDPVPPTGEPRGRTRMEAGGEGGKRHAPVPRGRPVRERGEGGNVRETYGLNPPRGADRSEGRDDGPIGRRGSYRCPCKRMWEISTDRTDVERVGQGRHRRPTTPSETKTKAKAEANKDERGPGRMERITRGR